MIDTLRVDIEKLKHLVSQIRINVTFKFRKFWRITLRTFFKMVSELEPHSCVNISIGNKLVKAVIFCSLLDYLAICQLSLSWRRPVDALFRSYAFMLEAVYPTGNYFTVRSIQNAYDCTNSTNFHQCKQASSVCQAIPLFLARGFMKAEWKMAKILKIKWK